MSETTIKNANLTDAQKVMLCIGFLKGIIQGREYVANVDVSAVNEILAEIQLTSEKDLI